MTSSSLTGRHILVVEDDLLLSMDICAEIEHHEGVVVGPAFTLESGRALVVKEERLDGAILNIRLCGKVVYPLAGDLIKSHVPLVFASSETADSIPHEFSGIPLLSKPVDMIRVIEHLFPASPA